MNTFEKELISNANKWRQKEFVEHQLLSHLDEVKELIENEDSHLDAELIDLINIAGVSLRNRLNDKELEMLIDKRKSKFTSRLKKKRELRLSLTENCNYRCFFCHEEGLDMSSARSPKTKEEIESVLEECIKNGYNDITFTGGEPLVKMQELIYYLEAFANLPEPPDITIVTNGYLVNETLISAVVKYPGKKKFNISLHAIDSKTYLDIVNPKNADQDSFEKVTNSIDMLVSAGIEVKANVVLLKGMNTSKEYIQKILAYSVKHKISTIKFLELLVTEKLKKEYSKFFDVYSIVPYLGNDVELIAKEIRRNIYKDNKTGLKIELQRCTCRVGCNKCLLVRDKTITAELKHYPCFILSDKGDHITPQTVKQRFDKGEKDIIKMARSYPHGSPILTWDSRYIEKKREYFYHVGVDKEQYTTFFKDNGYSLIRVSSIKEKYFYPNQITEDWKTGRKLYKIFSDETKVESWKRIIQEVDLNGKYDKFYTETTFITGLKPQTISDLQQFLREMNTLGFVESREFHWNIEFYQKGNTLFTVSHQKDRNLYQLKSEVPIEDSFLKERLMLQNFKEPLAVWLDYFNS